MNRVIKQMQYCVDVNPRQYMVLFNSFVRQILRIVNHNISFPILKLGVKLSLLLASTCGYIAQGVVYAII